METAVPVASRAGSGRDRLSNLPDCLLHTVLPSLRSRQAVHTCLLSRRWRHLWCSVPCLDVDQRDFPSVDDPVYNEAQKERIAREIKRRRSFEDFADAVLPLNGAWPLDAYRLHVADRSLRDASYRWIRRGLERRPEEFGVAYGYDYTSHGYTYHGYRYPHDDDRPFSFDLVSDGAGALPLTSRLRRLHLSGVTLAEKFVEELASEGLVLEELKLVKCGSRAYNFGGHIASRSLKRLHIEGRRNGDISFMSLNLQVLRYVLENVPNLERLVLKDCKLSGRCYRGESASTCSGATFDGCKNLRHIQVQYKDHLVPRELVVALTQIAKDVVRRGKRSSVGWLEWMSRVVSCSHTNIVSLGERYAAASVVVESDDSQSDEEHESHVRKHRARKKHERDGAIKAGRRAAHLARR